MPAIVNLFSFLAEQPGFSETVTFDQLSQFIGLASSIKNDILAAQPPTHDPNDPPLLLAPHQRVFLTQTCNIPLEFIDHCWLAVREMVWRKTVEEGARLNDHQFEAWYTGRDFQLSGQTLWPPTQQCTNTNCPSTQLLRERDGIFPVTLFTLRNGARATYSTYLTCGGCGTQYHPNYLVRYGRRLYYEEVPAAIEVARHIYVERELAELFVGQMLISWTSATNAAQLYNVVLAANSSTKQPPTSNLSTDHVWDAFTILTLLEDFARQGRVLDVPHGCVQANRFFEAMAYRTSRIADIGHEMDRHYCDKCMRVFQEENGELSKIHALVVDGICIGRPCCAYQLEPCKNPLMSKHARFCAVHAPESLVCAVVTCRSAVDEGYLTCSEPAHRQLESNRRERQKAMFYLSQVHHRHGISHPANSLEPDDLADDIELPDGPEAPQQSTTFTAQDQCPDKEDESARKLRGVFGRNRTHAEVVFHRPCGIMIRRETCYKAETLTQITESLHWLEGRGLLPEVLFYDNGCRLYRSFRARNDPLFDKLALPVDVFHWKSKHKKTDIECSYHCSPYSFPELRVDATGSWYFNSSVAEQNNVWLGGYHSMLREMGEVRYNFFLDEMILRRNRLTFAKLHDYSPGTLPTT